MHRTLKHFTANPPKGNMSAQQRAFNRFREEYNEERSHQGLGLGTGCRPTDRYERSIPPYPEQVPKVEYPEGSDCRKVKRSGHIKCQGPEIYISRQLAGEIVGLKPLGDERWKLYLVTMVLGIVDRRLHRVIRPVRG